MIGKIIGAMAGKKVSDQMSGVSGTKGALLGLGAATVLRRLGPAGMVAAALGGYAFKRYSERKRTPGMR